MSNGSTPPKAVRLAEFHARLQAAPCVGTLEEAFRLVCDTLNAVEDELTGIPYNQATSDTDGRMYPPLWDGLQDVPGHPSVKRFRHRHHYTFFGLNGSIEFALAQGGVVLMSKPGLDGRGVWQL